MRNMSSNFHTLCHVNVRKKIVFVKFYAKFLAFFISKTVRDQLFRLTTDTI